MTPHSIASLKECFDKLPKPDANEFGDALGLQLAGDQIPVKLFNDYIAAYKIISGMVQSGNTVVDGAAIALVRDAATALVTASHSTDPKPFKHLYDPSQRDNSFVLPQPSNLDALAGRLMAVFQLMEYLPPTRTRSR